MNVCPFFNSRFYFPTFFFCQFCCLFLINHILDKLACLAQLVVGNKHLFRQTELSFGNIAIPAAADGIGVVIGNGFSFLARLQA